MLYFASQSPFFIRKPIKIGKYYFDKNDKELTEHNKQDNDESDVEDRIEISGEEGINFKNFFHIISMEIFISFMNPINFKNAKRVFHIFIVLISINVLIVSTRIPSNGQSIPRKSSNVILQKPMHHLLAN